jgi:uncharacterized membrane protein
MHTSSTIIDNKKDLVAIPAACLSFLTLWSLSIYRTPDNYLVTLSVLTMVITVVLILVLWKTKL